MISESRRSRLTSAACSGYGPSHATFRLKSLARNSKCAFSREPVPAPSDPWTIHSLRLFVHGPHRDDALAALHGSALSPMVFDRRWTNRQTGEVVPLSALARVDLADTENTALLALGQVAARLQSFPWELFPDLRVNRLDLASDHLVSDPKQICDRIADLHLPYCSVYRGAQDGKEPWLTAYHNAGKALVPKVVVGHYSRLESLLHRHPDAAVAAVEYCRNRVRQEVRFRGPGLRRRLGGGPMTPETVLGSFPAFVEFAERRLRPVFEAGILSPPRRDPEGEATLAAVTGGGPQP